MSDYKSDARKSRSEKLERYAIGGEVESAKRPLDKSRLDNFDLSGANASRDYLKTRDERRKSDDEWRRATEPEKDK